MPEGSRRSCNLLEGVLEPARPEETPMTSPSRNTVGVYDRPHPLRTRKVIVPVLVAVVVTIGYAVFFYLR